MEIGKLLQAYGEGVRVEIPEHGPTAYVIARSNETPEFMRKREELLDSWRVANRLKRRNEILAKEDTPERKAELEALDATPVISEEIPYSAMSEVADQLIVGTTIVGWGGYTLNGEPLADRDERGRLHETNGRTITTIKAIAHRWRQIGREVGEIRKQDAEAAAKNSVGPSPTS